MAAVWITGAKGFIGQHLARRLAQNGADVLGLGHGIWPTEEALQSGVSYWINGEVDASNLWQLQQQSGNPSVIYHLAGGSSVGFSMQLPQEDYHRTVTSTVNLLEWARCFSPRTKIVTVSSAAVYGNAAQNTLPEFGDYTPFSPYGFHKKSVELLCESYARNFGLRTAVARLFSIYGTGLRKQLLWDVCSKLKKDPSELVMQGTGAELRDWLHIDDTVRILETISTIDDHPKMVLNVGTGKGISVQDIVQLLCLAWGHSPKIVFSGVQRPGDPLRLVADTSLLARHIDVSKLINPATGISEYVRWFKDQP